MTLASCVDQDEPERHAPGAELGWHVIVVADVMTDHDPARHWRYVVWAGVILCIVAKEWVDFIFGVEATRAIG